MSRGAQVNIIYSQLGLVICRDLPERISPCRFYTGEYYYARLSLIIVEMNTLIKHQASSKSKTDQNGKKKNPDSANVHWYLWDSSTVCWSS